MVPLVQTVFRHDVRPMRELSARPSATSGYASSLLSPPSSAARQRLPVLLPRLVGMSSDYAGAAAVHVRVGCCGSPDTEALYHDRHSCSTQHVARPHRERVCRNSSTLVSPAFVVQRGVAQGCPPSPLLYAIFNDPVLQDVQSLSHPDMLWVGPAASTKGSGPGRRGWPGWHSGTTAGPTEGCTMPSTPRATATIRTLNNANQASKCRV